MLLVLLIVCLVLAVGGGTWGHSRYGYAGWSPAAIVLLVLAVMWLTGNLRVSDTPLSQTVHSRRP